MALKLWSIGELVTWKDGGLRVIKYLLDVAVLLKSELTDFRRRLNETAEHEFCLHALCVMTGRAGGGGGTGDFGEVCRSAYTGQFFALLQFPRNGHDVDGLALGVQAEHGVEYDAVLAGIKESTPTTSTISYIAPGESRSAPRSARSISMSCGGTR